MPSFEGNLFTQRHQISSLETRDSRLSYGENPESHLSLIRYQVVTDRQTDRITIANTRSDHLPVLLSSVKIHNSYIHSLHTYNNSTEIAQT